MMNRIKFLIIIIVLFSICSINAQYTVGIFGGINNSGLIGDAPPGSTYKDIFGVSAGVLGEYKFTDDVAISIQAMYIQKGVKIAYSVFNEREPRDSVEIAINYFSIPILAKVYAGNEIIYVSGGFDIGFKLDATLERIGSDAEKEVTDAFKNFNIAAIVGLGAQFRLGLFHIFVEGRYSQGLGNISNPDPDDPKEINPSFRTSGLQFFAGITYSFGGKKGN